jgi:hypothetical protein
LRILALMVQAQTFDRTNDFVDWLDRMEFSPAEAAHALGKTVRMIGYYQQGHEVPPGTLYLMEAIEGGYTPPPLRRKR